MQKQIKIFFITLFILGFLMGYLFPYIPERVYAQQDCTLTDWAQDAGIEARYAVRISKCDESFIWQIMQASSFNFKTDGGFCHLVPEIVADKKVWTDWRKQMRFCYSLYLDNTHTK